ncbi:MAG: hypothetical protein LBC96_07145 [Lachnospiraceae bacterium]|jgi:tight adherence protein B|nr:hypothetical protein [Lachnospiraceae bacterium]
MSSNFSQKEMMLMWLQGLGVVILFSYFFFRSPWALPFLLPLAYGYVKVAKGKLRQVKQDELRFCFKEAIEIVAGNLKAGYAVENAFLEARLEVGRQRRSDSPIMLMLTYIKKGIENNIPLEERLKKAEKSSGVAEVTEFAEVFAVAKQSGGNVIDLIGQYATMIGDKIETEKEINVAISARRGEQRIMNLVPFAILFYIDISSPGFFASLYHNPAGIAIMTVCMAIYLGAYSLSIRMMRIEI